MTTLNHQVHIDAPVDAVWKALADLDGVQKFNPAVMSARIISDRPDGVGATRRCTLRSGGWVEERAWEWRDGRALGLEVVAGQYPVTSMRWRTELQREGGGTLVTQQMDYEMKFGVLGAILDRLFMRRLLDVTITQIFAGLKRYVETASAQG